MKVKDSRISNQVVKSSTTMLGDLYLFNDIAIMEFYEGAHVTFENAKDVIHKLNDYFKERPFGFISNMINSYSITPTDSLKFPEHLKNMRSYNVVAYNHSSKMSADIVNQFCNCKDNCFDNLYDAAYNAYNKVKLIKI